MSSNSSTSNLTIGGSTANTVSSLVSLASSTEPATPATPSLTSVSISSSSVTNPTTSTTATDSKPASSDLTSSTIFASSTLLTSISLAETLTTTTPSTSIILPINTSPTSNTYLSTTAPPTTSKSMPLLISTSQTVITSNGITTTAVIYVTITPSGTAPGSYSSAGSVPSGGSAGSTTGKQSVWDSGGKIAVAVVVPIASVGLLILASIYFWRQRKQRKDVEEQRRKEVEDYAYNPNADPTIPSVTEDASGYRGWGSTTLASSVGNKASTTMSGGVTGDGFMNEGSPSFDEREGEILGAMGPAASSNKVREGDVHRGLSNASSSYSAANRSDGSDDGYIGVAYGGGSGYYDQFVTNSNSFSESAGIGRPGAPDLGGQPVIRDVAARRNTRIEIPSHLAQQSAGISQNF